MTVLTCRRPDEEERSEAQSRPAENSERSAAFESLWTVDDAAAYLRVSKALVYKLVERGSLPCLQLGLPGSKKPAIRFDPAMTRAWATKQTRPATVHSNEAPAGDA